MSRITQQLLRKRAEHNECMLTTLQQISLHQQQIVKIQNLDVLCRHLKILYLQNNVIERLENLNKLKELEYLNVALNNISKIENIEGCESLKKLDLTVNFVDAEDLEDSVKCLSKLPNIKEIYFTGNPCEDWPGCRDYVIAQVDTLQMYNGNPVTPSQRIKARQDLPGLKQDLYHFSQMRRIEKKKKELEMQEEKRRRQERGEKEDQKQPYTKEVRRQMYYEMAKDKQKKERDKNPEKFVQKTLSSMYNKQGQIRQCNQGKYPFTLRQYDHPEFTFFELEIPKHMQTKDLEVNMNPKWVSVRVRGKLTQLRLSQEIIVADSKTERSQITGILTVTMKKVTPQTFIKVVDPKEQKEKQRKKKQEEKRQKQQVERNKRLRLCQEFENRKEEEDDQVPPLE